MSASYTSALGMVGGLSPWAFWGLLAAALLVFLLILLIVLRRRRRKTAGPVTEKPAKQPALKLRGVWKKFLSGVPFQYRNALGLYQPYIVFGDVGAGKSTLVERCTDWRGLAAQFHPSYSKDPNLQIYQGSSAIVEEHSASLLADTTTSTRRELTQLWKRLRKSKSPRVVVVVRADVLLDESLEDSTRRAQLVRGKINILSSLLRHSIDVSIAVVRMDSREGYLEFCSYLQDQGRELELNLRQDNPVASINDVLRDFEPYLAHASASMGAIEYLKASNFVVGNSALLERVSNFVGVLSAYDPATIEPTIRNLVLSSSKNPVPIANPFEASITEEEAARFQPVRKHRFRAIALTAVGMAYLFAGFTYENQTISGAKKRLRPLLRGEETISTSAHEEERWQEFYEYLETRKKSTVAKLLPSFRQDDDIFLEKEIHMSYLEGIRSNVLLKKLSRLADSNDTDDQVQYLYFLAIVFGTDHNATGRHVLSELGSWSRVTGLSKNRISDFVRHNAAPFPRSLKLNATSLPKLLSGQGVEQWDQFFSQIERMLAAESSPIEQLTKLQNDSEAILGQIGELEKNRDLTVIIDKLKYDSELPIDPEWQDVLIRVSKVDRAPITNFLEAIQRSELSVVDSTLSLNRFLEEIRSLGESKSGQDYKVKTSHGTEVTSVDWETHVLKSRLAASLSGFVEVSRESPAWDSVLFERNARFRPLSLRGGSNLGVKSLDSAVAGVFTKKAFDQGIAKTLLALAETIKQLPLKDESKSAFKDYVLWALTEYAEEYVDAYELFYDEYSYTKVARSLLPYVAKRLSSRRSVLRAFLKSIADNTQLDLPEDNVYAAPLFSIPDHFAFVGDLVGQESEQGPALAAFIDILKAFAAELGDKQLYVGDPAKDPAAALKEKLGPEGRIALANYLGQEGSYDERMAQWFDASGVPRENRYPFVGLFGRANAIGKAQIETGVGKSWKPMRRKLDQLFSKFPFNRESDSPLTLQEIEFLVPEGEFWTQFVTTFGALVVKNDEGWRTQRSQSGSLRLPSGMLRQVNEVQRLTDLLWLEDATPKPISIYLRPMPSSATRRKDSLSAVLATLVVADQKVLAFNQKPSWHKIDYNWWEPSSASINVVLAEPGQANQNFRSLAVPNGMWSLYRIFVLAKHNQAAGLFTWTVSGPQRSKATVRFRAKEDPWEPVTIKSSTKAAQ